MKRRICFLLAVIVLLVSLPVAAAPAEKQLRLFFTHDIHSYFVNTASVADGERYEHGGAARLKTLLDQNRTDRCVYLDAGDFSMGTLLQAGYATDAYELRLLGELGCAVTTFGNHEFDYGDEAVAQMLDAARKSGDPLPQIVQSNLVTASPSAAQKPLVKALRDYGVRPYTVLDVSGVRMAVFGLFGLDSLDCTPTTQMTFENYIESAKKTVQTIRDKEQADVVVCLSHCGTSGDGETGEDFDLAEQVPGIDVIVSGHSHSVYEKPVVCGSTVVVSAGEYLTNLGVLDLAVGKSGVRWTGYDLHPCDGTVAEEPVLAAKVERFKRHIGKTYLKQEQVGYDDVICRNDIDFITLKEMTETHGEYPFGNLIADSYLYEARRNGITDIDVALVGLGTIRDTFAKGSVTVGDAFEICSLGVGADGSAGHPLLYAYITGQELRLLTELDASLGPMVSYIKMSYSGLSYTFNTKRSLLDRVIRLKLVRPDGTEKEVKDDKLYKVVCNMYAANMLGMLNGLTRGLLKIVPKYADGTPIADFYDCSLHNTDGREIKEWVAFKNYLSSFPKEGGVPVIPARYAAPEGRKIKVAKGGLARISNPGPVTIGLMSIAFLMVALVVLLLCTRRRRKARRARRRAQKQAGKTP